MQPLAERSRRLAVLIDADNANPARLQGILREVAQYGDATVRRIYGDFTSQSASSWKKLLHQTSVQPMQQFAYTTGKNATDSAMIIDAMDILHSRRVDGFCLVSSDSDFTGLARRIREEGLLVIGFGEKKTPEPFRTACNRFIFTENIDDAKSQPASDEPAQRQAPSHRAHTSKPQAHPELPLSDIKAALAQSSDDRGWSNLGYFGELLLKLLPDFDSRTYGHRKLSELARNRPDVFKIEEREGAAGTSTIYVRSATLESAPRKGR
jgi:uncharacterized LabA/DUF88 family protein